ncbi:acetyl-CoA carboxylase biotin carboxyl carrier protein subunit [Mucilaginibacter gynuensis]|uniref:Acetyl-CoA carboxylase biotin carboxyl carrier protein subunit n=1 Tax=Mucilaginibacter gynuensis TaxID=1302236 RepID=A0ABP8H3W0_9SPHI
MYKVKLNDKYTHTVERSAESLLIGGSAVNADIKQINANAYHIIKDNASYNVEVISFDVVAKTAEIKVNNNTYHITAKDQFDLLLEQLGLSDLNSVKVSEIKAPMPGLVLKVFVTEGDEVKKGDNLFVLEAMKMENIIKSPADVTVRSIKLKPGDKVEKGQILILF